LKLRSHLFLLVAGATLPVVALSVALAVLLVRYERDTFQQAAMARTRALMTAIDAELRGSIATLEALAASLALEQDDLARFREEAVRVLASQPGWLNVTLADPSGNQLLNSRRPLDGVLPRVASPETLDRVVMTLRPAIGTVTPGPLSQRPGVPVRVPVVRKGEVKYVLTAVVDPASFNQILDAQKLPGNWTIGLVDAAKRFISRIPALPPGEAASPTFMSALNSGREGWFYGRTVEGRESFSSYSRSSFSDWGVGIAIPLDEFNAPAHRIAAGIAAGVLVIFAVALTLAILLGRGIARPISALAGAALALGRGERGHSAGADAIARVQDIDEIREVGAALHRAWEEIAAREQTQRRAEAALSAERGQLQAVFHAMSDGVVVFDMAGRVVLANDAERRLMGYSRVAGPEQEISRLGVSFIASDLAGRVLPVSEWPGNRVLRGESLRDRELRVEKTDNGRSWIISFSGEPVFSEGKQVLALVVSRDITDKKLIEDRLLLSIERYRLAAAAAGIGYWDWDLLTNEVEWSEEYRALCGIPPDVPASYQGWRAAVNPADFAAVELAVRDAIERRVEYRAEFRIDHPSRGERVLIGVGRVVENAAGTAERLVGINMDITEIKRAEEEVRLLNATLEKRVAERTAQLAEANLELEAFNSTVSHDLRAPLRGMQSFAQLLVADFGANLGEEGHALCRRIVTASKRMNELIEDLLAYSRLAREEIEIRPVQLERVVDEALQALEQEVAASAAAIAIERPLGTVRGHHTVLVQILQNLLGNAIKYVGPGVTPAVRLWAERGDLLRLNVADNGIGMDERHLGRIFRPFERLHNQDTYRGTGIGLAIVKRGAERLGGRCGVESMVGTGSRFWIELPAAE
jgi:PAS domain S-box-containing protein